MNKDIKKMIFRAIIGIIIILCLEMFLVIFAPTFGNDIAIGQLENDNVAFYTLEGWNKIQFIISSVLQPLTALFTVIWIWSDFFKNMFNKKG